VLGEIDGIYPLGDSDQVSGKIARASADIEHSPRHVNNKIPEKSKYLVRIRWTVAIGLNDSLIFERVSERGAPVLW
jgi:hypothetical protein